MQSSSDMYVCIVLYINVCIYVYVNGLNTSFLQFLVLLLLPALCVSSPRTTTVVIVPSYTYCLRLYEKHPFLNPRVVPLTLTPPSVFYVCGDVELKRPLRIPRGDSLMYHLAMYTSVAYHVLIFQAGTHTTSLIYYEYTRYVGCNRIQSYNPSGAS